MKEISLNNKSRYKRNMLAGAALALGIATFATVHASAADITVKHGDTVSKIAEDNNTTVDAIAKANGLTDPDKIYVGDVLKVNEGTVVATQVDSSASTNAPIQAQAPTPVVATPATQTSTALVSGYQGSSSGAKEQLAQRESGGNYDARNGQYVGRYQLSASYLNGDYSKENQERVADQYVQSRYGSWENALAHSNATGWY